jgi:hypothetical protein
MIFLKNINFTTILLILVIILGFFTFNFYNKLQNEKILREQDKKIYRQNSEAFRDSIHKIYDKKLDRFIYSKKIFLIKEKDLNDSIYNLNDKISEIDGELQSVIQSKTVYVNNNIEVDNKLIKYDSSGYGLKWKYIYIDPGFTQKLYGVSKFKINNNKIFPGKTLIDSNYISLKITYGFREFNDKYEVYAISQSPKIELTELNGAYFIDKKPIQNEQYFRRWVVGPNVGFGANFDSRLQEPRFGWNIGVSITYNLFGFGKKLKKRNKKWQL